MREQAQVAVQEAVPKIGKRKNWKFYFKKYLMLFVGAVIAAVGLEIFLIPNHIIDGGVVGISIMCTALTGLPFGVFLVLLNIQITEK